MAIHGNGYKMASGSQALTSTVAVHTLSFENPRIARWYWWKDRSSPIFMGLTWFNPIESRLIKFNPWVSTPKPTARPAEPGQWEVHRQSPPESHHGLLNMDPFFCKIVWDVDGFVRIKKKKKQIVWDISVSVPTVFSWLYSQAFSGCIGFWLAIIPVLRTSGCETDLGWIIPYIQTKETCLPIAAHLMFWHG